MYKVYQAGPEGLGALWSAEDLVKGLHCWAHKYLDTDTMFNTYVPRDNEFEINQSRRA